MRLNIARWGNSLAVRLPVGYARAAGLKAGDEIEARLGVAGELTLAPAHAFDKTAFLERVRRHRAQLTEHEPAVAALRAEARY
jgi:antitoxin MazE